MKIIATIIQDYDGEVSFHNGKQGSDIKSTLGYIPQEICLEQTVTALQNLYYFGKIYGLKGKQLKQRAEEVLAYIGLPERGNEKVLTFSGGMKRRLNIGCALMNDPKVIIMDEPTVGIDPQSRRYIFEMITQLKRAGCTIIYASHYMEEVEQLCDEVAFIDQGKIVESGSIEHLLRKYAVPSIFIKGQSPLPENIEQLGTISEKNGGYLLTTTSPLTAMDQILKHYLDHKQELERLELVQPRLEDVFFSLTGNQLRD